MKAKTQVNKNNDVPLKIFSSRGFLKSVPRPDSPNTFARKLVKSQGKAVAQRILEANAVDTFGGVANPVKGFYRAALAEFKHLTSK
jgi:hypothetical protein